MMHHRIWDRDELKKLLILWLIIFKDIAQNNLVSSLLTER